MKALAFLVFAAALAGATWGVQTIIGDEVVLQSVSAKSAHAELNATGGHTVTFPVTLSTVGVDAIAAHVRLVGDGAASEEVSLTVPAAGNRTAFVPVAIDADAAPGKIPLKLEVTDADGRLLRARDGFVTVKVLEPAPGFENGDSARVYYTGRTTESGLVFNTNDPAVVGLPFAEASFYRASPSLLPVQSLPRPSVVEGFFEGILGMQPGESRTVTFGHEKGYGPALEETREPRIETLDRVFHLELRTEQVGRTVFNNYVAESGQGNGTDFAPGDIFEFVQGPNRWPYKIVDLNDEVVDYILQVNVDDRFTLYPVWENASLVQAVNETHVTFVTTPTTEPEVGFTMRSYWPELTKLVSYNETEIVLRHDLTPGMTYSVAQGMNQPALDYTVKEVTDEEIVLTTPSQNPLAGKTLTFDIRLVELTKG